MRALLFEATPEEFARVEAMFRAGGDPILQTRSLLLSQGRPRTWPELGDEHCYQLAKRVLERAPTSCAGCSPSSVVAPVALLSSCSDVTARPSG